MPPKKGSPKKSRGKNQPAIQERKMSVEIEDFDYWRNLAKQVVQDLTDPWHISEVATIMHSFATGLAMNWETVSKICDKNQDKTITMACPIVIDRRNTPPEVTCTPSYGEKHRTPIKRRVPDPSVNELPLEFKKGDTAPTDDGEKEETPPLNDE